VTPSLSTPTKPQVLDQSPDTTTEEEIDDARIRMGVEDLLCPVGPGHRLRVYRLDRAEAFEVTLFDEEPSAWPHSCRHLGQHRLRLRQVHQNGSAVNQVEARRFDVVHQEVQRLHLDRWLQMIEEAGIQISGQNLARRTDTLAEPRCDRAAASGDLQASPTPVHADPLKSRDGKRVCHRFQTADPFAFEIINTRQSEVLALPQRSGNYFPFGQGAGG
jgi:hypothetical protein